MLGCFNPILSQKWTNSNIVLKMLFKNVTQWLYLTQNWVETIQHFLECTAGTDQLCPIVNNVIASRLSYGPISLRHLEFHNRTLYFKHQVQNCLNLYKCYPPN